MGRGFYSVGMLLGEDGLIGHFELGLDELVLDMAHAVGTAAGLVHAEFVGVNELVTVSAPSGAGIRLVFWFGDLFVNTQLRGL